MSPPLSKRRVKRKTKKKEKTQKVRDKWFLMRNAMREAEINRKSLIQTIADFIQKILPGTTAAAATAPLIRGTPKSEVQDFSPAHTKPSNTLLLQYSLKIP
jgi:hypothetical protein